MSTSRPVALLLMRKDSSSYHSIEYLFETLAPFLSDEFQVRIVRVPCQSSGILRCARNLAFTAKQRADIIHVTGDIHYCALAVPRTKCILTIHDLCSLNRLNGPRKLVFSLLWYWIPLRWARHVTVVSEETRRQLKRNYPTMADKAVVIPNCVDDVIGLKRRITREGLCKTRVLQVGTAGNKNLDRVATALSGLPVQLRIIGALSTQQRSNLHRLDLEWTSSEGLSRAQILDEYRNSDVLIFASTYEGFGLPIVEAQAIGLPVITSNMPPMTDVAGDGALFVDPYDEQDIRSALVRLLRSPELAQRLSLQGRRNAQRFDASTVAVDYKEVYKLVCHGMARVDR